MSRLRVLHLIHHLRPGGAERLLADMLPLQAAAGLDVRLVCLEARGAYGEALIASGIPVHLIGRGRGFDWVALLRLRALLRELAPHILNVHGFSAGFRGRLALALSGFRPRLVETVHAAGGRPLKERLGNRLARRPRRECFVAVSACVRRHLEEREGLPPDALRVIPNGICAGRFWRSVDPAADRIRLGLPPDGFLVGLVARCRPEKGGAVWVRALAALVRAGFPARGVLVGDGPARGEWEALARTEGVRERIVFAGAREDAAPWLAVLDALACPSLRESFGLAALEGQAAGAPVVAARTEGLPELLHDGEDALLVPPGDPEALAAALARLETVPALARRLRAAGRANAADYPIARTAEGYVRLYRELAGGAA